MSTLIQVIVLVNLPVVIATILSTFYCQKLCRSLLPKVKCNDYLATLKWHRTALVVPASAVPELTASFEKFC